MKEFFSHGSPFLKHPLLTEERTRREIDFLVDRMELLPPARVLDVGCGFGRHSIELAGRGYCVFGIDPAGAMIEAARERAAESGVAACFRQVAAEEFVHSRQFDAALCLFTTLGQISPRSGRDNRALLGAVADLLRPEGRFALELPQRGPALRALRPADRYGDAPNYACVRRSFDADTGIVSERFEIVAPEKRRRYDLVYRLFDREEVGALLAAAGLRIVGSFGGYDGARLDDDSPVMLFVCAGRP